MRFSEHGCLASGYARSHRLETNIAVTTYATNVLLNSTLRLIQVIKVLLQLSESNVHTHYAPELTIETGRFDCSAYINFEKLNTYSCLSPIFYL